MASITNILGEKALSLSQEEFVRGFNFGANWNKIRIGMLCRVNGSASIGVGVRLHMGLCTGTTNTLASSSCAGYVAVKPYAPSGYVWDGVNNRFNTTAGQYIYSYYWKTGNSVTELLTAGNVADSYLAGAASGQFSLMVAQFLKLSATSIRAIMMDISLSNYTFGIPTTSDLYSIMEAENIENWAANWVTQLSFSDILTLPSNVMQADSLSLYWNQVTPTLDIGTCLVSRYY